MIKNIKMMKYTRITLCIVFMLSLMPTIAFGENNKDYDNEKIIVSMGDSYSSGEGIEEFYDQELPLEQKILSEDWLAHRSKKSWGGQLTLPNVNGTMAENRNSNWYFVAVSGAETKHIGVKTDHIEREKQSKTYYKKHGAFYEKKSPYTGTLELPFQDEIFEQLKKEGKKADYVTITIGGNDVGFSSIITQAAHPLKSNYLNPNAFSDLVDSIMVHISSDDITEKLKETYTHIHNKSGAKIIVAGYPKLLEQNGKGALVNKYESEVINDAVHIFNLKINKAVLECELAASNEGIYHFVSVEDGFNGKEAYSDEPYLNEVLIPTRAQDIDDRELVSSYSIHPNEEGAGVYRDCVQAKLNELERTTSDERDIVLVLDVSGSMSGTPMEETKKASSNFISTILKEDASIGIVTYDSSASMPSDFSMDEQSLKTIAENITDGGGTNIESGLIKAKEMLDTSHAKKKIIVLMSDGEPNHGKVGDELISYADSIKDEGIYIYTLGFFENMGSSKSSAQILMEKIASEGCHYEVANADDLKFFFGDIADQINGQKYIYVRIACPVDVKVTHNGEVLSSEQDKSKTRTSFGSLTFEENQNKDEDSTDDRIKILRLKDGEAYDIKIEGNGIGEMNYTIGFMDENGEYSDLREFNDIEISKRTQIDTVASNSSSTMLNVDSDGDGKYDLKYKAKANGIGEIVDYSYIYYIVYAVLIFIALLIIYVKIKKWKKNSLEREKQKKAMKKKFCVHCGCEMSGDKNFCPKCGNKVD